MLVLVQVLLLSVLSVTALSVPKSDGLVFLAKTKETFKFADLQLLQAQLDANRKNEYHCRRLVLDSATGSSLFLLEFALCPTGMKNFWKEKLPPSLARCEWVAEVLAQGRSANDLVQKLKDQGGIQVAECTGWTLNYVRMNPKGKQQKRPPDMKYNLKTLLCSVAPWIQAPAVLDPDNASHQFILVETTSQGIYLGRFLWRGSRVNWQPPSSWAKRPFQYSSAIHPTVAEILVELVLNHLSESEETIHLLDPTCGSGSFLAFALACGHDVFVEGWDANPQCVEGTKANLRYVFGEHALATACKVEMGDSTMVKKEEAHEGLVDCMIANLPWGENTVDYVNQNFEILKSVRTRLRDGAPCIFVHKDDALSSNLNDLVGYELLGEAFVPPLDFSLPKSRKTKKGKHQQTDENHEEDDGSELGNASNKFQRITVTKAINPSKSLNPCLNI